VVYIIRPQVIAKALGIPQPLPFFVPYLEILRRSILRFWAYLLSLVGRQPPKID
jgi:hypothetical protein